MRGGDGASEEGCRNKPPPSVLDNGIQARRGPPVNGIPRENLFSPKSKLNLLNAVFHQNHTL